MECRRGKGEDSRKIDPTVYRGEEREDAKDGDSEME